MAGLDILSIGAPADQNLSLAGLHIDRSNLRGIGSACSRNREQDAASVWELRRKRVGLDAGWVRRRQEVCCSTLAGHAPQTSGCRAADRKRNGVVIAPARAERGPAEFTQRNDLAPGGRDF